MLDYEHIKFWYDHGIWSDELVRMAVEKHCITEEDYYKITGNKY